MANELPTEEVFRMKKEGLSNEDISRNLEEKGYDPQEISESINQLNIRSGIGGYPDEGAPISGAGGFQPSVLDQEEIPVPTPPSPQARTTPATMLQPSMPQPIMPSYEAPPTYGRPSGEESEELVEAIIDEKWQEVSNTLGELNLWKSKVDDDLTSIKQEILRISHRFDNLQKAVLEKVSAYSKDIAEVGTEVKALERVLQNIIKPLTTNIKELSRITGKLKKH